MEASSWRLAGKAFPGPRVDAFSPGSSAVPGRQGRRCAARCARPVRPVLDCPAQLRWLTMNVARGRRAAEDINADDAVRFAYNYDGRFHRYKEAAQDHNRASRSPTIIHGAPKMLRSGSSVFAERCLFYGARARGACLAATGSVELELKRRWLERLVGRSWPSALGPVRYHLVCAAGPVGDSSIERLQRQPAGSAAGDERVEAASEAVDLDNVPDLDSFESHRRKLTQGAISTVAANRVRQVVARHVRRRCGWLLGTTAPP
jgi:hypothetical protein